MLIQSQRHLQQVVSTMTFKPLEPRDSIQEGRLTSIYSYGGIISGMLIDGTRDGRPYEGSAGEYRHKHAHSKTHVVCLPELD